MNDVTTLLLNSIGAGNRGEGRGQEAATKQGNGQLFGELMNQQIAARTNRSEQTNKTQGQKQLPEKQLEEKLVKEQADTSSNPVGSPQNDQGTKKASQDQQDKKIIAEDASAAGDNQTAQSKTSKDKDADALGQQADLNAQPIQNPPVLLPQVIMPNSVAAEALPANPTPQTTPQSTNQAVPLINSTSNLTDLEVLQANGVGQPLSTNANQSDSSFAQLPAPNPLNKANSEWGQQETSAPNATSLGGNIKVNDPAATAQTKLNVADTSLVSGQPLSSQNSQPLLSQQSALPPDPLAEVAEQVVSDTPPSPKIVSQPLTTQNPQTAVQQQELLSNPSPDPLAEAAEQVVSDTPPSPKVVSQPLTTQISLATLQSQPSESLPEPLANDAQPNVTVTNSDVLAPAPAKMMMEAVATSPDHDPDNIAVSNDAELSVQHQSHNLSGKEDGAAPLTTPNLVQSPAILQTIDGAKQVAQVAIDPQQSSALAQQVTFAIRKGANEGTSQMHIKLNPVELGGIDIRMEVDADHHVRAILTIERPETYDLLHKDAQHLQKLLGESGLKLADANAIQYEQRSASSLASNIGNSTQDWLGSGWFGQQGQAGRHALNDSGYSAARHPGNDDDDTISPPVNLITYTHGQADGRVNIRV